MILGRKQKNGKKLNERNKWKKTGMKERVIEGCRTAEMKTKEEEGKDDKDNMKCQDSGILGK